MKRSGHGLAGRLFESTIYNRPHAPADEGSRERWARVEALQASLCAAKPGETPGLLAELMQAMEMYHVYEKREAFILGFKAGGQAMRELLEE